MKVIGVNGINGVNSNQGYKKNSHQQNFGQLIFTTAAARDSFAATIARKISGHHLPELAQASWRALILPHIAEDPNGGKLFITGMRKLELWAAKDELIHRIEIGETQPEKIFLDLVVDDLQQINISTRHKQRQGTIEELIQQCEVKEAPVIK